MARLFATLRAAPLQGTAGTASGFLAWIVLGLALGAPVPAQAIAPVQVAKLVAGDAAAEDWFGLSVAVSGNTAVVGSLQDDDHGTNSGSAYVFVNDGSGWTQQAKLTPSDPRPYYNFGHAVAIDGDTIVVGAHLLEPSPPYTLVQDVYVFVRSGDVWTQQATLSSGITTYMDEFGESLAIDGDTIVVGAFSTRLSGFWYPPGAAYVFVRNGSAWTRQAMLTAGDPAETDRFGYAVDVDGDTIVVGANMDDDLGTDSGAAYVFTRTGGAWSQQAKLTASDGSAMDYFGEVVALSGDTAVVGARLDDDYGASSGSAYFFERSGTGWSQSYKAAAGDAGAGQLFGTAVAIDGPTAAIGANVPGQVYLFGRGAGGAWAQSAKVTASTGGFGTAVSVDGETLLAGGFMDSARLTRAGAAFVFQLPAVDADHDGILDADDNCPYVANPEQTDSDADGYGDACDSDDDNDGVLDGSDNCRVVANSGQANADGDPFGDACDGDIDGDGFDNRSDNCPYVANVDQTDSDGDGAGDECDGNDDNDARLDADDNCPAVWNDDQADLDSDGIGDACDSDLDGDGVINTGDNCPVDANTSQDDTDQDGAGDACDDDDDNDAVLDGSDNCPFKSNAGQADSDGDGEGDACDGDLDGDTVANAVDNCMYVANSGQADFDVDGIGDACDEDVDGDGVANTSDDCAVTPAGGTIDRDGCTVDQLCPCSGPSGTVMPWRNHGKYVSCVAQAANRFLAEGLITLPQHGEIVSAAGQSTCGGQR